MQAYREMMKSSIMFFSYKERRARELLKYKARMQELEKMEVAELEFEYISWKSLYEHKKSVLVLLVISIVLSLLMNVWKYFFEFMQKALQYYKMVTENGADMVKTSFIIALIMGVFITFMLLYLLFSNMNRLRQIQKELLIIESVRNRVVKG